jgi:hypothetical protein
VLLTGPGLVRNQFRDWCNSHQTAVADSVVDSMASDHPSDGQLVALAGPSALATVLLLVSQAPARRMEWVAALCATMAVCAVVLVLAERIQRVLGERVVMAFERLMGLMGLILVAISVEMLLRGIQLLITQTRAAG